MALRLLPRDERFFELFVVLASKTVEASRRLIELFTFQSPHIQRKDDADTRT